LRDCERGADGRWHARIVTGDGSPEAAVAAPWVIDATGRSAWFARRHGGRALALDRLVGLIAEVPAAPQAGADQRLTVEACPEGWWYTASLPGDRRIVAWMTDADLVPRRPEARRRTWLEILGRTRLVGRHVGDPQRAGPLGTVAARSSWLDRPVGPGWIATGDAAMAVDPLSGRGIIHAIESGQAAAEALLAWFAGNHEAVAGLAEDLAAAFDRYRALRQAYYTRERRWHEAPFWSRRQW
jgi:flavin-dependent dehydrogenase